MLVRSLFDAFSQNTHKAEVCHPSEPQRLLIHASLQITAKSTVPARGPEHAPWNGSAAIWKGFHNFISNNGAFSVPRSAANHQDFPSLPVSHLSSHLRPWLKGKTGVNVVLQPAGPGLRSVSALKAPFFTSLIAFTPSPSAFHLQPTSMSVVCFLSSRGESEEDV